MYRILSLDGGGVIGISTLAIIKKIMERRPDLIEKADLIAGTSIGGILALSFALNHDINHIEENFIKGIPLAFNTNPARMMGFVAGLCSKYDNRKFKVFLRAIYGLNKLKDLSKKVLITSFCIDNEDLANRRWKTKVYHNFNGVDSDEEERVLDVAMATSSAPVFFKAYHKYIDGAIVANNPALCAVAQTQDERAEIAERPKIDDIVILSLGSVRNVYIENKDMQWGYFMWSRSLLNIMTENGLLMVDYIVDKLLRERYHRICPVISESMDDFMQISKMKTIGEGVSLEKTFDWLDNYWS